MPRKENSMNYAQEEKIMEQLKKITAYLERISESLDRSETTEKKPTKKLKKIIVDNGDGSGYGYLTWVDEK